MTTSDVQGRTSQELADQLLTEAIAYGEVEVIGATEDGVTLFRRTA